ncbi:MAG: NAD(P)/FAD-dependent oxidoreductase [SAR202 cluster bacterium]|nr:NAD(P)/FAD-dependent oxidoreductase [SAR202 cluster bacterium]
MKIGIIGGGAAGLAAAYEFGLRGHQAEVFERAPFLGGQASTFPVGGTPLERGYHHLFRSDTAMTGLMEELGLGHQMRWIDSNVGFFSQGRIWRFTTPIDLMRFGPLPLLDRVRLGLTTMYLQRRREWRSLEQQTAREWTRNRAGKRVYEVIFEPMLRGKFGEYYDQISMAWLWNKFALRTASRGKGLKGYLKEQLGYPIGSFAEIFDTLAERINKQGGSVCTSAAVQRVAVEDGEAKGLEVRVGNGPVERRDYDLVLATVSSYIFPSLVPPLPEDYAKRLSDVVYLSAIVVTLVLDRQLSPVYWMYVGDRSMPFLGMIEHTNLIPASHYGNNHIVYLTNYLSKKRPYYALSKDELLKEYEPHLKRINSGFDLSWVREYHYFREDAAQPIVTRGYSRRIPDHHTPFKRLYLANTTQIYPEDRGTNYSVRMGRQVARLMMDDQSTAA